MHWVERRRKVYEILRGIDSKNYRGVLNEKEISHEGYDFNPDEGGFNVAVERLNIFKSFYSLTFTSKLRIKISKRGKYKKQGQCKEGGGNVNKSTIYFYVTTRRHAPTLT